MALICTGSQDEESLINCAQELSTFIAADEKSYHELVTKTKFESHFSHAMKEIGNDFDAAAEHFVKALAEIRKMNQAESS